jgi:hypothetical protein
VGAVIADYWDTPDGGRSGAGWHGHDWRPALPRARDGGFYRAEEVAQLFHVDRGTVDRWCRSEVRREMLGAYRVTLGDGRVSGWRFPAEAVHLLLEGSDVVANGAGEVADGSGKETSQAWGTSG